MADQKKIAEEIKSKGFAIAKCDMNDESPDEWVMFGVWFFLKQNFFVDLDWRTGKYYFYLESERKRTKEQIVGCVFCGEFPFTQFVEALQCFKRYR